MSGKVWILAASRMESVLSSLGWMYQYPSLAMWAVMVRDSSRQRTISGICRGKCQIGIFSDAFGYVQVGITRFEQSVDFRIVWAYRPSHVVTNYSCFNAS